MSWLAFIIIGVILIVLGYLVPMPPGLAKALEVIGAILVVVGVILLIMGLVGAGTAAAMGALLIQ